MTMLMNMNTFTKSPDENDRNPIWVNLAAFRPFLTQPKFFSKIVSLTSCCDGKGDPILSYVSGNRPTLFFEILEVKKKFVILLFFVFNVFY